MSSSGIEMSAINVNIQEGTMKKVINLLTKLKNAINVDSVIG